MGLPRQAVRIEFSGLRPGEKLDEELFFADETRASTSDDRVTCATRPERSLTEVRHWLAELREAAVSGPAAARETLLRIVATDCGRAASGDLLVANGGRVIGEVPAGHEGRRAEAPAGGALATPAGGPPSAGVRDAAAGLATVAVVSAATEQPRGPS
jgi:hypothetical protein